jgi:hypothetical protein
MATMYRLLKGIRPLYFKGTIEGMDEAAQARYLAIEDI